LKLTKGDFMEADILDKYRLNINKEGHISGFSNKGYEELGLEDVNYLSPQRIKKLKESGKHYEWRYIKGNKDPDTPAKRFGRILHWALLEPAEFKRRYVIEQSFKGTGSRAAKAEWLESLPEDSIVIKEDEAQKIANMIDNIYSHPMASKLLSNGIPELKAFSLDPEFTDHNGNPIQWFTIFDYYRSGNVIVEVKTTKCAKKFNFRADAYKYGYHIQNWINKRVCGQITNEMPKVYIVAIENVAPYCVEVYPPTNNYLDQGYIDTRDGIEAYCEGLKSGVWNSYSKLPSPLDLPGYAYFQEDESYE
jgi:hypothetical protein